MHGKHGVEQVRQADALGFGNQPEQRAIAVETPRAALLDNFQTGFVVPVQQFVGDLAVGGLVGEFKRFGAKPLHADDGDQGIGHDATQCRVRSGVVRASSSVSVFFLPDKSGIVLQRTSMRNAAMHFAICRLRVGELGSNGKDAADR